MDAATAITEHINIFTQKGYPMFLKSKREDKNKVILDFVVDGENTTIIPGTQTLSAYNILKAEVLEVLEERPAKGEHQIENPVYYSVRCLIK